MLFKALKRLSWLLLNNLRNTITTKTSQKIWIQSNWEHKCHIKHRYRHNSRASSRNFLSLPFAIDRKQNSIFISNFSISTSNWCSTKIRQISHGLEVTSAPKSDKKDISAGHIVKLRHHLQNSESITTWESTNNIIKFVFLQSPIVFASWRSVNFFSQIKPWLTKIGF